MDIYIKPSKKVILNTKSVTIGDICEVVCDKDLSDINSINVLTIQVSRKKQSYFVVSSFDIVRIIKKKYPKANITNYGEKNTLIEFDKKNDSQLFRYFKIIFVSTILFTGCATAIVAFHVESQLDKIFQIYASILNISDSPDNVKLYLEIPYAVGIALGIIIFFNHVFGKNITADPTPIEVEMSVYDEDVVSTLVKSNDKKVNK